MGILDPFIKKAKQVSTSLKSFVKSNIEAGRKGSERVKNLSSSKEPLIKTAFKTYIKSPTGQLLPQSPLRKPVAQQNKIYQEQFENLLMGATTGPKISGKTPLVKSLVKEVGSKIKSLSKGRTLPKGSVLSSLSKTGQESKRLLPKTLVETPAISKPGLVSSSIDQTSEGIVSPVTKIINAIKEAKPIRSSQEALYRAERGKRFGAAQRVGENVSGEKGFYSELSKLKGALPKAEFESLRGSLTQPDIDELFNMASKHPYLSYGEKLTAREGLAKLLGVKGSGVPTKGELSLLKEVYGEEFAKTILEKRPLLQKIWDTAGQVLSVPRSLLAGGLDMSFGLRQGVFAGYRNPKQWASSFKEQFKYFFDENALRASTQEIRSRPTYNLMRDNKLALTDLGQHLSVREEQFVGTLAEKIPLIGKFVRASGRAYTGFANKFRADIFDHLVETGRKTGAMDDPNYLPALAEFVNNATGRGSLGRFERAADALTTTLFSPRLLASRINLLNPIYYARLQPEVRKEALKTLVSFIAGGSTVLGLSKLAGAEVVTDPTNSDFGKMKIGNTRIDTWGGFQQPIVLLARLITGKMTSSTTGKISILGEGYKPTTRLDIITRFFESKEAPIVSFLTSLLKGQTNTGEDFELKKEVAKRLVPMFIQDMIDLYKDGGLEALPLGIPAFFGAGVQTYGDPKITDLMKELESGELKGGLARGIAWYEALKKLPKDEANSILDQIQEKKPALITLIESAATEERLKMTNQEREIKAYEVDKRAVKIIDKLNSLPNADEKNKLLERYEELGIITKSVWDELDNARNQGKLKGQVQNPEVLGEETEEPDLTEVNAPEEYKLTIKEASDENDVPVNLLTSLLKQESGFNPNAKSSAGALGIAQFMPATAQGYGIDPLNPDEAIKGAARHLADLYNEFGSWDLALAAYNAGSGNVRKYGGIPPFTETRNYVKNIMAMANM